MNPTLHIKNNLLIFLLSVLGICLAYITYIPSQSDFYQIILPYALAFGIYIFISAKLDVSQIKIAIIAAIFFRVVLVFAFPNLSDDIYRFLWDSLIVLGGDNPYAYLPTELVNDSNSFIFEELNSQQYYSPYPPVSQAVYSVATLLSSADVVKFSIIVKLFMLASEILSILLLYKLLARLQLPIERLALYALNPLIILELVGNLHFEAFMILFVLAAVYFLDMNKILKSALCFTLAIASKLLPLMFIPFFLKKLERKKAILFLLFFTGSFILLFSPVWAVIFEGNFLNSLDLYFRKFEFNASIYYVLRYLGFLYSGWNMIATIGPLLGLIALLSILYLWKRFIPTSNTINFIQLLLFSFIIYLASATTVHPWYLALPISLCIFTSFRFPIYWSGLIFLTYYNYSMQPYHENLVIVSIEYLIVAIILSYELRREFNTTIINKLLDQKKPS